MKHADVVVGEKYATRVGQQLRVVEVRREVKREGRPRAFAVASPGGAELPRLRTAAALRRLKKAQASSAEPQPEPQPEDAEPEPEG